MTVTLYTRMCVNPVSSISELLGEWPPMEREGEAEKGVAQCKHGAAVMQGCRANASTGRPPPRHSVFQVEPSPVAGTLKAASYTRSPNLRESLPPPRQPPPRAGRGGGVLTQADH
ncbi:unnamed protein product [Gadus morhua 'NCC']